jgi:hypothetical protein
MKNFSSVRMTYLSIGVVVLTANLLALNGIFLAGNSAISWLHWLPPVALTLAGISGICPFQIFWEKLGFAKVDCEK